MAEQTFAQAFAAARKAKGPGKTFTWKGKSYSTNTAEDAKKSSGPTRPQPRPEGKAPKAAPGGARPAPGGAGKLPAAKADSTKPSPVKTDVKRDTSSGPTVRRGGADTRPKAATNESRMADAKADAAARRAKSRADAGIGGAKPAATAKPQGQGNTTSVLQSVKDFFAGGGLAGRRARQRAAEAKAKSK